MKKYPKITNCIRGAVRKNGYSDKEFSELIGMPYQTLQIRWRDPGSWRFYEWGAVKRRISFTADDLKEISEAIERG